MAALHPPSRYRVDTASSSRLVRARNVTADRHDDSSDGTGVANMNTTRVSTRLDRVREAVAAAGADWLLVPASPDFRWLTGARTRSTERLVALALPVQGE